MMRAMRKLEPENIAPKPERPFEVGDGDAGVIGGDDAKWHISENVQRPTRLRKRYGVAGAPRPTLNSECWGAQAASPFVSAAFRGICINPGVYYVKMLSASCRQLQAGSLRSPDYPTAAITLSSIAIGVGSAVTSTVVRVGFGLPSPAKYSA